MVISVFRRREIGQPFLALAAVSWNAASAAPGAVAVTSRWTFVTAKPASARALILHLRTSRGLRRLAGKTSRLVSGLCLEGSCKTLEGSVNDLHTRGRYVGIALRHKH